MRPGRPRPSPLGGFLFSRHLHDADTTHTQLPDPMPAGSLLPHRSGDQAQHMAYHIHRHELLIRIPTLGDPPSPDQCNVVGPAAGATGQDHLVYLRDESHTPDYDLIPLYQVRDAVTHIYEEHTAHCPHLRSFEMQSATRFQARSRPKRRDHMTVAADLNRITTGTEKCAPTT